MKNNVKELLLSYVDALHPIIYINHFDFNSIDDIISDIKLDRKVLEFSDGIGFVDFETKILKNPDISLYDFLNECKDLKVPTFLVLKDIHEYLQDSRIVSLLRYISENNMYKNNSNITIFIVSSKLYIPEELENYITVFDVPLPNLKEIKDIILEFKNDLEISINEKFLDEVLLIFKGLNEFQIRQILNLAYLHGGRLDFKSKNLIDLISMQKEQLIKKSGLLEIVPNNETLNDIGGLENLKSWLKSKEKIFSNLDEAIKFGLDIPKGILIVGMPGCGKSLASKATANLFKVPLVRLDIGRLLGKYVGESEENMRKAIKLAEAISPCVLWIDEIEKAFSGIENSNNGDFTTKRLFGQFLTWMQEKENSVFIVATANDISAMPPEFLRKERFDELFYVDLPNKEERKKIFEIYLEKRKKLNGKIDIVTLVNETNGYSGADLKSIVKDAIETCFNDGKRELTTEDLIKSKESIKSISISLKKHIEKLKDSIKDIDLKAASK